MYFCGPRTRCDPADSTLQVNQKGEEGIHCTESQIGRLMGKQAAY